MDDSHGYLTPWLRRLTRRFGGSNDDSASDDPSWKRYGRVIQILVTLGILFGGVFDAVVSTVLDGATGLVQAGNAALSGVLWPALVAVTVVAVAVCVVVVGLGVRNA